MADFELIDNNRFSSDFLLSSSGSCDSTDQEKLYLSCLNEILNGVADRLQNSANVDKLHPSILRELESSQAINVKPLREAASKFIQTPRGPERNKLAEDNREDARYYEGVFNAQCERILLRPFDVLPFPRSADGTPQRPSQILRFEHEMLPFPMINRDLRWTSIRLRE